MTLQILRQEDKVRGTCSAVDPDPKAHPADVEKPRKKTPPEEAKPETKEESKLN